MSDLRVNFTCERLQAMYVAFKQNSLIPILESKQAKTEAVTDSLPSEGLFSGSQMLPSYHALHNGRVYTAVRRGIV